jgi:tight adherence protein B
MAGRFHRMAGRAAIGIPARRLLLWMVVASMLLFLLLLTTASAAGSAITPGALLLLATVSLCAGLGLPLMFVNRRAQKRSKKMEEQFPTAIDIFTRALRSGHPIASAINLLTTEMEDPVGSEFGLVADEIAYGSDLNESLANLADRWDLEDLRMFAVCVSVQSETGGNLAEILHNLAGVIRERASLYLKVRALSSEGRMSAWMLSILPVLTFLVLFMINPGFYLEVAQDPIFTSCFTALVALYGLGVFWIRKMVDLKV